ncbi:MAG TPA: trimeric intracellular cation channel family protein [Flavobacteriaceae bacterium]|nr:trimeric intracellular cation channel family protein [Flavobacteriaceae bacterium]
MNISLLIDILGMVAFAISGVLTAMQKRMDVFGIFIIAFVTAVGGGTLRDLLLNTDIVWMQNMTYLYVIFFSAVFAVVFRKKLNYLRRSLFLFDTVGIALYTIVGVEKGIAFGLHPIICVALGTMSACFGGVTRDILCNEIPIIFRKEIYATACILGGLVYFLLSNFSMDSNWIVVISGAVVFAVRLLAVRFHLSLPSVYSKDELNS